MVQISKYKITAVIGEGFAALSMLRKLFISKSTEYVFALNYSTSGKRKLSNMELDGLNFLGRWVFVNTITMELDLIY